MYKRRFVIFAIVGVVFGLLSYRMTDALAVERYGTGLTAGGSEKSIHTIFTNPGEDASKGMNISFATRPGIKAIVEVFDGKDTLVYQSEGKLCTTFDSIFSKLANNDDVIERHIFDKHSVTLSQLQPDTKYSYRIMVDSIDTRIASESRTFRTAGANEWKAAVVSDFHHYSPLWRRLDAAMAMIDVLDSVANGFDFVLSPGDQCAWGASFNYWTELSEQPAYKNYMWAGVQGNHDHQSRENMRSDAFFRDSHANPLNGYEGQEGVVYWFRYGDVLFLMLNNEAMRTAESLNQVKEWMEKVIKENPSTYVVVVQHYQWLIGTNGANSQLDRFADIFDRLGVDLAISGNNHAYIRTHALRNRNVVDADSGTFYVVAPSCDNSRGRSLDPMVANEDIVATRWSEGPQTVGAMIMDVNPQRIEMTLYDRRGIVQDRFAVPAKR